MNVIDSLSLRDLLNSSRTYPNGLFDASNSVYWKGSIPYSTNGTWTCVSNIGSTSASSYAQWSGLPTAIWSAYNQVGPVWLPPSPIPSHLPFPNLSTEVDEDDPVGSQYVLGDDSLLSDDDQDVAEYFSGQAIAAVRCGCNPGWQIVGRGPDYVHAVHKPMSTTIHNQGRH